MAQIHLTDHEEELIQTALRGNYDPFIEYFFRTEFSGTWYTTEDRVEQYAVLYRLWDKLGRPESEFVGVLPEGETALKVVYDPYYNGYPMFLLPHGFRILPWIKRFVSPQVTKGAATTGTGSGKTCNIAIPALAYCALLPGFRFLNGGPTQHQSDLMLGEVVKWTSNAPFEKFIEKGRGTNPYWTERPYPTIKIISPLDPKTHSTFVCQTIAEDANNILGGERDWINIDEAQLVRNIAAAEPRLVTRMRGTRATGLQRWSKLTWISNPGNAIEFVELIEKYAKLAESRPKQVDVMMNVDAAVNIYITARQREEMEIGMTDRQKERWLLGNMDAVMTSSEIPRELIDNCTDMVLDERVRQVGTYDDDFGLLEFELPYDRDNTYMLVGDAGKSPLQRFSSMNVPVIIVFDVTDFPQTVRMVAFSWIADALSYKTFTDKMKYLMMKYRCKGYYDAGNVQTAFEDFEGAFANVPFTQDIYFSGSPGKKRWALAACILMMQAGSFKWPVIKGLIHQARIYDIDTVKKPDDIVMCLLIFARVLAIEGTLWSRFVEYFQWEWDGAKEAAPKASKDDEFRDEEFEQRPTFNRYSRISA